MLKHGFAAALVALALVLPAPLAAGPALVFDPADGTVLYEEDMDALWHPASLTKMMTAYLVFEKLRAGELTLESKVQCSKNAAAEPPSKIGLPVGGEMGLDLALRTLLVKSANDVAVMLAEKVAGSEAAFIERMNEKAAELGMKRTRFVNPNGLPDDRQITTARDMAYLARALIRDFPEYAHYFSLKQVRVGKTRLRNYNKLLKTFEGADGMKTGYVCASGYNLVASATRDGRRLVAIVLGGKSGRARNERAAALLEHAFRRYQWKSLFGPNIDSMAVEASLSEGAMNLCPEVRRARRQGTGGERDVLKLNFPAAFQP